MAGFGTVGGAGAGGQGRHCAGHRVCRGEHRLAAGRNRVQREWLPDLLCGQHSYQYLGDFNTKDLIALNAV